MVWLQNKKKKIKYTLLSVCREIDAMTLFNSKLIKLWLFLKEGKLNCFELEIVQVSLIIAWRWEPTGLIPNMPETCYNGERDVLYFGLCGWRKPVFRRVSEII